MAKATSMTDQSRDPAVRIPNRWAGGRIVAVLLLVAIIPSFLVFYWQASERGYRDAIDESRHDVIGVTVSVTEQLSRALESTDFILRDIASRSPMNRGRWLPERVTEQPQLRAVLVTDAQGVVRDGTIPELIGLDLSDRRWMAQLAAFPSRPIIAAPEAGRYLGEPGRRAAETGRWTIPIARPIFDGSGAFAGAAIALLNPEYLTRIGERIGESFGATIRYYTVDGVLLAAAPRVVEGIGERHGGAWLFRDFLPQRDSGTQVGPDSAGREALASFAVTTTGLMAVEVSLDMPAVLAPARERATLLAAGLTAIAAMTLLAISVIMWSSARIAREQIAARSAQARSAAAAAEAIVLRNARAETQRLLGGLPAIIFRAVVAADGSVRHRYIGGNVETVTGWQQEQLATMADWHDRFAPERPSPEAFLARVRAERTASHEFRLRQPNGDWRWLRTVAMVLDTRSDGSTEIVGHIADISAERDANAQIAAAGRLTSLGQMATSLAHELRQPLATMSLAAENIEIAVAQKRYDSLAPRAERIVEQARRASNIIEHLRRFARGIDENEPLVPFTVQEALNGAVSLMNGMLRNASATLDVEPAPPGLQALGHQLGLEQVLLNLIINACHQLETLPADAPRRITLGVEPRMEAGEVQIFVRDNGGGIAPEILPRLFEPFTTTKGPEKGTGLGLSICHGLVTSMGGRIEATNEGEGARFSITLRLAEAPVTA